MKAEFIAATLAEQQHTGGPAEICAVLNRLPHGLLSASDDEVIEQVDALMDDLYRQGELVCPGHRWLSGPQPPSIRGHLMRVYESDRIHRDAATGEWGCNDATSYFSIPDRPGETAAGLEDC